jgi:hypothetical protein
VKPLKAFSSCGKSTLVSSQCLNGGRSQETCAEKFPCKSTLPLIVYKDEKSSSCFSEGLFLMVKLFPIVRRTGSKRLASSGLFWMRIAPEIDDRSEPGDTTADCC